MSTFAGIPGVPSKRHIRVDASQARIIRVARSLPFDHSNDVPENEIATVRAELRAPSDEAVEELEVFCTQVSQTGLQDLRILRVETFDQHGCCAPSLAYYSQGDTRRCGRVILASKEIMARVGFVPVRKELPDHPPAVLKPCAFNRPGAGEDPLGAGQEGIEVFRTALHSARSPYAHLLNTLVPTPSESSPEAIEGY